MIAILNSKITEKCKTLEMVLEKTVAVLAKLRCALLSSMLVSVNHLERMTEWHFFDINSKF